jgi:hypothetical protein
MDFSCFVDQDIYIVNKFLAILPDNFFAAQLKILGSFNQEILESLFYISVKRAKT